MLRDFFSYLKLKLNNFFALYSLYSTIPKVENEDNRHTGKCTDVKRRKADIPSLGKFSTLSIVFHDI